MRDIRLPRQVGLFVRETRKTRQMTQRQLAQAAGVSERSVLALEAGDATGIRLDKLLAVLNALGAHMVLTEGPGLAAAEQDACRVSAVAPQPPNHADADPAPKARLDAPDGGATPRRIPAAKTAPLPPAPFDIPYQQLYDEFVVSAQKEASHGTR